MIDEALSDRLRCMIYGATQCYGFALVTFYEDGSMSAVVNYAPPRMAAEFLNGVAGEYDSQMAQQVRPV